MARRVSDSSGDDPDQHASLAARRDRHVAAYEEGESAEHLLLDHVRFFVDQLAYPIRKFLVIGHGSDSRDARPTYGYSALDGSTSLSDGSTSRRWITSSAIGARVRSGGTIIACLR